MVQPAALAQEQPEARAAGVPAAMEEVFVTGRQRSAADDILNERMKCEVISDLISAEQISRVGDAAVSTAPRGCPAFRWWEQLHLHPWPRRALFERDGERRLRAVPT